MSFDRVHRSWDGLIGREAAELLGRRALLGLLPIAFLALTPVVALVAGRYYWLGELVLGLVTVGTYIALVYRANRRLAAAMSAHLGVSVSPSSLPRLLTKRVVKGLVLEARGVPRRERSFLGGAVRVSLPPKDC